MNPLHSRTISGFPLSIGTGIAMETLFTPRQEVYDPERIVSSKIKVGSYQELFVNVLTLIRNAYGSCTPSMVNSVTPMDMVEIIMQEIDLIKDLLSNEGQGFTIPTFYFNDYKTLFKKDDRIFKRREDKTELQRKVRFVFEKTKDILTRQDENIKLYSLNIKSEGGKKSLLFTHIAADLLSYNSFEDLELLESHTGKVKKRTEWNTKYNICGDENLGRFPFCRQLLSCFGDKSLIVPITIKARKEIIEVGKKLRWTPATSASKVAGDLSYNLKDTLLASVIRGIPLF